MADPITLGFLGVGALCLFLWYVDRSRDRARDRREFEQQVKLMTKTTDRLEHLPEVVERTIEGFPRDAPPSLVRDQLMEHHALFNASENIVKMALIRLRHKFASTWTTSMFEETAGALRAKRGAIEEIKKVEIAQHTVRVEIQEGIREGNARAKEKSRKAERDYEEAEADHQNAQKIGSLKSENELLEAQQRNEDLKGKAAASEPSPVQRQRQEELDQIAHEDAVLDQTIALEKKRQQFDDLQRPKRPKEKLSPEEQEHARTIRAAERIAAQATTHIELDRRWSNMEQILEEAGIGPGHDTYEHMKNRFDELHEKLRQ